MTRYGIIWTLGKRRFDKFMEYFGPVALLALVYTVIVLFGLQGRQVSYTKLPMHVQPISSI